MTTVAGDATHLDFPDRSFDVVFCAEVLEHIPELEAACHELARVARRHVIIGVPYREDTRVGRTTCPHCGRKNPPWGHVNTFTLDRLRKLFAGMQVTTESYVESSRDVTNALSAWLMDLGGNPWGTYQQHEPCIHCGGTMVAPPQQATWKRACSAAAETLNRAQRRCVKAHANWIHVVLTCKPASE